MSSLPAIHICLISPAGYVHADALLDPAQYFAWQFRRLGLRVSLARNLLRHDAVNFVFGAHCGFDPRLLQTHSCIIVNLEQIGQGGAVLGSSYLQLLKSAVVVDYNADNPPAYTAHPDDVPIISFGHAAWLKPDAHQALPLEERPLDLLFIGSTNERRLKAIQRIQATGRKVSLQACPVYGSARNSLILQAKALLNLHFYETARFEQVRAFQSLSLATPVVSERHINTSASPVFDACVTWFEDAQLEVLFEQEFDTPLFHDVARQQLALFETVDPIEEYADLAAFAGGVWQAHQDMLPRHGSDLYVGPRMPLPWVPPVSRTSMIPGIPLVEEHGPANACRSASDSCRHDMNDAAHPAPLFQMLPDVCDQVDQLLDEEQPELALLSIVHGITSHFYQPGIAEHALYYPALDRRVLQLADRLQREMTETETEQDAAHPAPTQAAEAPTLLVASEVYEVGGHTRVLEELAANQPNPILLLTNLWGNFDDPTSKKKDWLRQRFPNAEIIVQTGKLWDKARQLVTLCSRRQPAQIWYLQHHQDPVAFVGTLHAGSARKMLVHHGDHNPSLGCTLPGVRHVDVTESLQRTCSAHLHQPADWLPLYVKDLGRRPFLTPSRKTPFSVVTAGRAAKFSMQGPVALPNIVSSVLRTIDGRFHHIGPLDDGSRQQIRKHLINQDIDPARFVTHGEVPSLWLALKQLDAHAYLGSAPVSGGRGAIEAQGCGYPVLPFSGFESGSLLADYSSYADMALAWHDLPTLVERLKALPSRLQDASDRARTFYEARFSQQVFRDTLEHLAGQPVTQDSVHLVAA